MHVFKEKRKFIQKHKLFTKKIREKQNNIKEQNSFPFSWFEYFPHNFRHFPNTMHHTLLCFFLLLFHRIVNLSFLIATNMHHQVIMAALHYLIICDSVQCTLFHSYTLSRISLRSHLHCFVILIHTSHSFCVMKISRKLFCFRRCVHVFFVSI